MRLPPVVTDLIPRPYRVEDCGAPFRLTGAQPRISTGDSPRARFAAERLAELLQEEFGIHLEIRRGEGEGFFLSLSGEPTRQIPDLLAGAGDLGDEGYILQSDADAVCVHSPTAAGLFWGAMTLRQLVTPSDGGLVIPGVRIIDKPRYRWRGFMIDSGRSPNSLAKIRRVVRICSAFKLNFLVFREGDDELCSVRYNTNLLGSTNPHAFTIDQIRELADYAAHYSVALVPEIESLGHSTAKGFHYPGLVSGGFEHPYEGIGSHIRKSHLAPADPRSYALLESIYDEWFPIITSPLVHLGLDEVRLEPDPQARHLEGLLALVDRIARKHHREITPIVWADAPQTPPEYADGVIRCLWAYGDSVERVGSENPYLVRQGLVELSEPGCAQQVFAAAGSGSGHSPYSKTCYEDAFHNIAEWTMWGADRPNFTGVLAVQWSGNMIDDWLPDFVCAADHAWNPPDTIPDFEQQMARVRGRLSHLKDAASPESGEVDPPAWDGIWLKDGGFDDDLVAEVAAGGPSIK